MLRVYDAIATPHCIEYTAHVHEVRSVRGFVPLATRNSVLVPSLGGSREDQLRAAAGGILSV